MATARSWLCDGPWASTFYLTVGLTKPHPGDDVTYFVHCEPPVGHPFLLVFQEVGDRR